jgi:hypothetical protein
VKNVNPTTCWTERDNTKIFAESKMPNFGKRRRVAAAVEWPVTQIVDTRVIAGQTQVLVQWALHWQPLDDSIMSGQLWKEYCVDGSLDPRTGVRVSASMVARDIVVAEKVKEKEEEEDKEKDDDKEEEKGD